ncbi:RDD family protein [Nocardioides sp. zg-536]|uniref:RDD family protein n=1 Tax=Nocardioides faecalis TaxID=2803858 RepID=A0A938Y6H4_9ACTN|nr:RDD family protein [Nocardioides faecalis]MBM9460109.1 RDD family protein [Nocardioides faecalis]MBS4754208.1 RDD family protein [Nocardioides faecalis]QVI60098.1 RDD family protein [Nocardioides faecalis]
MIENAPWGRRILALIVDWLLCTVAVIAVYGIDDYSKPGSAASFVVLGLYVVESTLLTWLAGGSIGKLLTGLCVVPARGPLRRLNPFKVLLRQVMVVLVIPPLVFRPDGRGLHDEVAGTSTITFTKLRELTK